MLDKKASDQGTEDRRKSEYTAKDALIAPALARGDDIADRRHRRDHQDSAATTLESTARDQRAHCKTQTTQLRPHEPQGNCALPADFAYKPLHTLPLERIGDCLPTN